MPHSSAGCAGLRAVVIHKADLRGRVREKRMGHFIVFVVDASGSMGAGKRMVETKGAVLSLLLEAYQKRDKVGLVAFRGEGAEVLLPPTGSVDLAYKLLAELPTGGKTPLVHGLSLGYEIMARQLRRDPTSLPVLVVISDGRANVSLAGGKPLEEARECARVIAEEPRIRPLVVDVEKSGMIRFGLAERLAADMGAQYFRIEDLRARDLVAALRRDALSTGNYSRGLSPSPAASRPSCSSRPRALTTWATGSRSASRRMPTICFSENLPFPMAPPSSPGATLSSFNWSEKSRAGQGKHWSARIGTECPEWLVLQRQAGRRGATSEKSLAGTSNVRKISSPLPILPCTRSIISLAASRVSPKC